MIEIMIYQNQLSGFCSCSSYVSPPILEVFISLFMRTVAKCSCVEINAVPSILLYFCILLEINYCS